VHGDGPHRVADQAGQGGSGRALADDVTDDDRPVAGRGREDVVEVAADLVALPGRPVDRPQVQPTHVRERRRQQAVLQRARELPHPRLRLFRPPAGDHQLGFVRTPVDRQEHRDPDTARCTAGGAVQHRVEEHGKPPARAHQRDRELAHLVLHLQKRGVVGLVKDAVAGREQVAQGPTDQRTEVVARPPQERPVGRDDRSVRAEGQETARRVLVELFG